MKGLVLALLMALAAPKDVVKIATPEADAVAKRGQRLEIVLNFTVAAGFHINSSKPTLDYLIPTRVEWASSALKHLADTFPTPTMKDFDFSPGAKLAVYQGTLKLGVRFSVPENAALGKTMIEGKLRYQACDEHACYPPATALVSVPVEIKK